MKVERRSERTEDTHESSSVSGVHLGGYFIEAEPGHGLRPHSPLEGAAFIQDQNPVGAQGDVVARATFSDLSSSADSGFAAGSERGTNMTSNSTSNQSTGSGSSLLRVNKDGEVGSVDSRSTGEIIGKWTKWRQEQREEPREELNRAWALPGTGIEIDDSSLSSDGFGAGIGGVKANLGSDQRGTSSGSKVRGLWPGLC